ncbi:thiol-disulfide oxidoreductase ResA [mine drainage metagenome]|uniref:Thiol-disulfide oxidoreductase ResA n=1 Tax=mine drainage metagenome TaxID=410659 RepID=A0A1J5PE71_9ZZZZ
MNNALILGPLALPYPLLLVFVAAALTFFVGKRSAQKGGLASKVENQLWITLLIGLIAARLAFVWEFHSAYGVSPLDVLDIRDGGWSPVAGFTVAWLFALSQKNRLAALYKPVRSALLTGSVVWFIGAAALSGSADAGQELPALSLTSLTGQTMELTSFKGQPVVVNLWATLCPPCVREMPVLRQAQIDHPDVTFVFVNQRESVQKVGTWLSSRQLGLRNVLLDTQGQVSTAFQQRALPTTLFFDAAGHLVSQRIGGLSPATLAQELQKTTQK